MKRRSRGFPPFGAIPLALGCCLWALPVPSAAQGTKLLEGTRSGATILNAPVTAEPGARKPLTGTIRIPTGNMAIALTAAECTTLGGETVTETVCNSGKACQTTTQDGDWKRVCLSKAE